MSELANLGIFLAGVGFLCFGVSTLWWCSMLDDRKKDKSAVTHEQQWRKIGIVVPGISMDRTLIVIVAGKRLDSDWEFLKPQLHRAEIKKPMQCIGFGV